ncbi:3-hydroxyacyl-ACP dehydratase FabZ, partial [Salmonella enterica]|uniref:3-hydroxyacyl-ACP dehydratase FabZ n=1 Tax=Salmonella enterica TaxID=28901 RepID=UPI003FA7A66B
IKALKNVSINEPYFVGHFPHRPVMPGVLMMEALAQAAALLTFADDNLQKNKNAVIYFVGIDGARFKRPVEPGDQLILEVETERVRAGIQFHLTPSRAQPRAPSELAGEYRTERATEPLPATTAEGKQ